MAMYFLAAAFLLGAMQMETLSGCSHMLIDVGANNGDTVRMWYAGDSNRARRGCDRSNQRIYQRIASAAERHHFCALMFEANPRFEAQLKALAASLSTPQRVLHALTSTAFALSNGTLDFGIDPNSNTSSSLMGSKKVRVGNRLSSTDELSQHTIRVQSMDAVWLLRTLQQRGVQRVILKIDVEGYEFDLLRGLVSSGALCDGVAIDLLLEWHLPRSGQNLFDPKREGLPTADLASLKKMLLWTVARCPLLTVHSDWC